MSRRPRGTAGALAAAALLASCATAGPSLRTLTPDQKQQSIADLQAADRRVAAVAYRLAAAGAAICPARAPLTGITLHARGQYAPALRDAAGFAGDAVSSVRLLAVAPGSPAADAGLQAGDALVALGDVPIAVRAADGAPSYAGVRDATVYLEKAAATGSFRVTARRRLEQFTATVTPTQGCASRVQLLPSARVAAKSDGIFVSVTSGLLAFLGSDDELALALAHEMAHNVLGHRALLAGQGVRRGLFGSYGSKAAKVLETEIAADRFSYYLMARAGFEPGAAAGFWKRLYEGPAGGFKDPRSHPDARSRIARATAIAAEIRRLQTTGGQIRP